MQLVQTANEELLEPYKEGQIIIEHGGFLTRGTIVGFKFFEKLVEVTLKETSWKRGTLSAPSKDDWSDPIPNTTQSLVSVDIDSIEDETITLCPTDRPTVAQLKKVIADA